MELALCSKSDFDQILQDIDDFWGSERTLPLHHPMFINEFGNSAFVFKEGQQVLGYLFGFISQTAPLAYVHLIGVRRSYQGQGLGRRLYEHFIDFARAKGCKELKAITTKNNGVSLAFHKSIGMELIGEPDEEGIPIVRHYSGPGQHRVVFRKKI
ncbi:MAG: GNAT family N-acetyltransferase [Dehalococcoidales bacterium]|jgi:GNAT superfamily N-acetyltransferase|nr:GNAT family N-acetyltransferase [Dehalococcoidales bacterium]